MINDKKLKTMITTLCLLICISINLYAQQIINVNEIRNFNVDSNTIIREDGIVISQQKRDVIGTGGFKIRFRVSTDVNTTISQGTLTEMDLISDIKGPITALNPLTILNQQILVTADTVLVNMASVSKLVVGDVVSVSGAINEGDNSMQLSRLELDNAITEWKLRGFARNITATNFTIGNLTINTNAVAATNCSTGFIENAFVEIKATPDASYLAGNPLTTLNSIECQTPDVDQDPNNTIPVVVEGMVSEIIDLSSFRINDLVVFFDANTEFDNGEAEHIDLGTKLEIQGFLDTNTRFINATTVRFIRHRVKFIAPVLPTDIGLGSSITVLGKQVMVTPQTRDDDSIISAGIAAQRQVEVRGFADTQGNIFALRVKDKGTADNQDVKLRGDISAINQPMIELNGVVIDASTSLFEIGTGFVDINTFFAMLQVGMQAEIEHASYDNNSNILSSGTVKLIEQELEDDPNDPIALKNKFDSQIKRDVIGTGGVGIATITRIDIIEQIFSAGFE